MTDHYKPRHYSWQTRYLLLTYNDPRTPELHDHEKPKDDTYIEVIIDAWVSGQDTHGSWNPYDGGEAPESRAIEVLVTRKSDGADITDWIDPLDMDQWVDKALRMDDDNNEEDDWYQQGMSGIDTDGKPVL